LTGDLPGQDVKAGLEREAAQVLPAAARKSNAMKTAGVKTPSAVG
jgi:hypothetical protein